MDLSVYRVWSGEEVSWNQSLMDTKDDCVLSIQMEVVHRIPWSITQIIAVILVMQDAANIWWNKNEHAIEISIPIFLSW